MAKKNLGNATAVSSLSVNDSILVEVGGSVRRISVTEFMDAIQSGGLSLRLFAWGVPIKQSVQSSPDWGRVGNLDMWEAYKAQCGRYLLSNDGSKMAKLAKNDSSVYADGTALDETKGHVMFYGPRLYYLVKENEEEGIPYLWMSEYPIGGNYIEAPIVGAYKASLTSDNKLTSRSGVTARAMTTITDFWNYAQNNGTDFGLVGYQHRQFMMMLLLSEFGNPNSQEMIGYGCCGSTSVDWQTEVNTLLTGATKSLGDSCGKIDITSEQGYSPVDPSRVSLFGIEDAWGFQSEMTQGIYFGSADNSAQDGTEVFIYEGNRLPTSDELSTQPNGDFRKLTRNTTSSYQYVKEMILGEYFDLIMLTSGGGSNQYWTDAWYGSTTGQLCIYGGRAAQGAYYGLVCVYSDVAWSNSAAYHGSRLAYYGKPTIVNGAEM